MARGMKLPEPRILLYSGNAHSQCDPTTAVLVAFRPRAGPEKVIPATLQDPWAAGSRRMGRGGAGRQPPHHLRVHVRGSGLVCVESGRAEPAQPRALCSRPAFLSAQAETEDVTATG